MLASTSVFTTFTSASVGSEAASMVMASNVIAWAVGAIYVFFIVIICFDGLILLSV